MDFIDLSAYNDLQNKLNVMSVFIRIREMKK